MQGRPTEWGQKLSGRVVTIAESDWFEHEGSFLTSFVVDAVPVTATRVDGTTLKNFTLKFVGRDVLSATPLISPDFEFERPVDEMPPMELPTGDTTSPGEMRQHPLGVQVHFERLVQVARSGRSSFLVAAPRRFGKTTLLTALIDALKESDVVAIKVTAVEQSGANAFLETCNRLGEVLGSYVPTEWFARGNLIPDENAFDAARRQAHVLGKRAIYLLFDESQYMFAGKSGKQFAELLKVRIENEWGRVSQGMVPIRLGLVGQYHLRRMIAGQLDGVFAEHQIIEREIRPDLIEKLVRESTRSAMQSTADARRVLAKVSGNLYILRFLLQELRDQLIADRRTWFIRQDVERAIEAQIERATKAGGSLAAYIRDPLNASDSLTEWQPTSAYPVAIAWAVASGEPLGRQRRLVRTRELLEGWAREFGSWTIQGPRIERGLSELRDAGVLADEDDRYNSRLLQRYLESLGHREAPFREEAERRALQALVVDQVRLPEERQEIGRGGQATVFVGVIDDRQSSVRTVQFASEVARQDFVETCHALKAIEGTRRRTPGYDALPLVRYAGFTDDVNPQGIVVYDWVPGKDLSDNLGKLSEVRVVAVGRPLAEGLRVLSQRRIVHRDIKPENVILRPDGTPVLIDFGLAKLLDHSPDTQFQHTEFLAPEVRHERPNWTSQADVYALAQTLSKLLSADEGSSLRPLLKDAMHPDPSRRLTADLFAEKLGALADRLNLEGMRQRDEATVHTELAPLTEARVRELAERHLPAMLSVRAGFFRDVDALSLVAQFLDDVFGQWCRQRWTSSTSPIGNPHLSNLESFISIQGRQPREDRNKLPPELQRLCAGEIVCCGFLRHMNSHGDLESDMLKRAKRHLPPGSDAPQLKAAVQRTGERLAEVLKIPGLASVTRGWIASIKW
jgi:serine/threonine protein kinase